MSAITFQTQRPLTPVMPLHPINKPIQHLPLSQGDLIRFGNAARPDANVQPQKMPFIGSHFPNERHVIRALHILIGNQPSGPSLVAMAYLVEAAKAKPEQLNHIMNTYISPGNNLGHVLSQLIQHGQSNAEFRQLNYWDQNRFLAGHFLYAMHQNANPADIRITLDQHLAKGVFSGYRLRAWLILWPLVSGIFHKVTGQIATPAQAKHDFQMSANRYARYFGAEPHFKTDDTPPLDEKINNPYSKELPIRNFEVTDLANRHVVLDDIYGIDNVKDTFKHLIEGLQKPHEVAKHGSEVPNRHLLYGPPGTGKTMLAEAIACEAKLPFFYASGSEFNTIYQGSGVIKVDALIDQALRRAEQTPSKRAIIFIDEIDSLVGQRGGFNSAEKDNTLNHLLQRLSGINKSSERLILVGSTNRVEALDEGFLSRFPDKYLVHPPSKAARLDILKSHFAKRNINVKHIDLDQFANLTWGMAGRELEQIVKKAAYLSFVDTMKAKRSRTIHTPQLTQKNLHDAFMAIRLGSKSSTPSTEAEKMSTALHEGAHAIIHSIVFNQPPSQVIILPLGMSGGSILQNSEALEKSEHSATDMRGSIATGLAAYIMFKVFNKGVLTGTGGSPSADLAVSATRADKMVRQYGMGHDKKLVPPVEIDRQTQSPDRSQYFETQQDKVVEDISQKVVVMFKNIGEAKMNKFAEILKQKEVLTESETRQAMAKAGISWTQIEALHKQWMRWSTQLDAYQTV